MSNKNHISDQDLRLIVSELPTDATDEQIETHVAECEQCQNRLLNFAADDSWRDSFCHSVCSLSGEAAFDQTDTRIFGEDFRPSCDDFDRQTVDRMLENVLQPPTHPETLGRLGRYAVEKMIGFGGMGIVLRGFDHELHRPVAIKMISPRLASNGTAKERFIREAKAAGALLHPNVIAIHDINESNGVPWFVMPLVLGPTLQEVIENHGPLPAKEVVRIGKQIAAGLAAAHRQGLVHRDIKPANILVDNQINRIVITDFGLARREAEESMTQTGMVAGTLNYMSPEQSRGEDVDARSDLFSLGSLLFFLSTGVTPFQSSTPMGVIHKVSNDRQQDARSLNPEVPAMLSETINRLLEKLPSDRLQSAIDVEEWLAKYLAHMNHPTQMQLPSLPAKPAKLIDWTKTFRLATCIAAGVAALAIIFYAGTRFASAPNREPTPPPTITWSEIKQKHNIKPVLTFENDLSELTQQIEQLRNSDVERSIPQFIQGSSSKFDHQLQNFDRNVIEFSEELRSK